MAHRRDLINDATSNMNRSTRRHFLKTGVALGAALPILSAAAGCGSSSGSGAASSVSKPTVKPHADGDLSWLTWSEYVPPGVVKDFESHYGVKVTQTFMASNEESVQKLATGQPFDLITTNSGYMPQFYGGNLLQPYDPADLQNAGQLTPYYRSPWWDNGRYRYTVPYGNGPDGIMYLKDKDINRTGSWSDMFTNPHASGHIYVLDAIGDALGMSLLKNGDYCNSGDTNEVNKAADDLIALKPQIASFTTNLAPLVAGGDAWMMQGWLAEIYYGLLQSKDPSNIGWYFPKGPMLACDTLSIGAKAKAPGTALLFMDWILQYPNNFALGKYTVQETGAKGGTTAFRAAVKEYPMFDFSDSLLLPRQNWKVAPTGPRLNLWNQAWARVQA